MTSIPYTASIAFRGFVLFACSRFPASFARMLRLMGMSREVASVPMAVQRFTCKDALGNFALPDLEALQKYQARR